MNNFNMLKAYMELQSKGIEFDFKEPIVQNDKISYVLKFPKKVDIVTTLGEQFTKSYNELKEYAKEKLAYAIGKDFTKSEEPIDKDLISISVKISATVWDQDKYNKFVEEFKEDLTKLNLI